MSEDDSIETTEELPATAESLAGDFAAAGVTPGSVLLVHSSLSSLGWVCGGPVAVIEALKNAVGHSGTVVMPTHSNELSEPSTWENPPVPRHWWPIIRESMPAFDPEISPTRGMGVIPECFRTHPGVLRSSHPNYSFAAFGPQAPEIISDHPLEDALGERSPLGRLYELKASVLLIGVGHGSNTSLHLAEIRAVGEKLRKVKTGAPVLVDGRRQWVEFNEKELDESDFPQTGQAFAEQTGAVESRRVAQAEVNLMPMAELVDFGVQWFRKHRVD